MVAETAPNAAFTQSYAGVDLSGGERGTSSATLAQRVDPASIVVELVGDCAKRRGPGACARK